MESLIVAAIDFGTTYSGWAFSFRHEFERDPTVVSAKNWSGGKFLSQKAPTCVLVNPDGKTLHSFGFEAESKYAELAMDGLHKQWYFFKRFKMMLFGKIGIKKDILLEDATGKKVKAQTVFALAIKFLKDDLLKTCEKRIADGGITNDDICWVLTVPAIWNDTAKTFMRNAAEEAGISHNKLETLFRARSSVSVLPPPSSKQVSRTRQAFTGQISTGTVYLILDAGGGTVDITVHQIMEDNSLRELHKASGGAWGGTKVDEAFENFLGELVGKAVIAEFKEKHVEDYIEVFRDFELKKREMSTSPDAKVTMRFPLAFFDTVSGTTGKSVKDLISKGIYQESVAVLGDKIRIGVSVMKALFETPITSICGHIKSLLQEPSVSTCSAFLLVGGFSESPLLQEKIHIMFPRMKMVIPDDAGLAVLKGAVIFGHNPNAIAERKSKYTYGVAIDHESSSSCAHPPCEQELCRDGKTRCKNLFSKHVSINQTVKIGEETASHTYCPPYADQTSQVFRIYTSSKFNPEFITESGCEMIGSVTAYFEKSLGTNRAFDVSFRYGETEIEVKIIDRATGKKTMKSLEIN